jgi:hypothetical protein
VIRTYWVCRCTCISRYNAIAIQRSFDCNCFDIIGEMHMRILQHMQIVEIYCFTCYNWELTVMINFIVIWGAPLSHESCDNKKHMHLSNYIKTVTIKWSLYRDRIVPGYSRTTTYPISSYHRLHIRTLKIRP